VIVRRGVTAVLLAACCTLAAACSDVVAGHGVAPQPQPRPPVSSTATGPPSAPPTQQPSVPSGVPTPIGDDFRCPTITYLFAHLAFRCIVGSMQRAQQDPVWPLSLGHSVERRSGWSVSMGAGHYGAKNGLSLRQITERIRAEMIRAGEYGTGARATTIGAHPRRFAGHRGFLLASAVRISATTRSTLHTAVHVERQWIAAVQIGRHDFSMWFVSIPDLTKQLWRKVPAVLASIRVR
jgi:hypothetical protein